MYFTPELDNENYLLKDLRRNYVRAAANQGWFEHHWLGVPIWQIGEDLIRMQQVVSEIKPKWIIETGTKFGGSAIFFGSVLHGLGLTESRVITIDIQGQPEASDAFSKHHLKDYVATYIIDSAVAPSAIAQIQRMIEFDPGPTLVFLDDNHNRDHVLTELRAYGAMVTPGSLIVVADTVYEDLAGSPVGKSTAKYEDMATSNPRAAIDLFLEENSDFIRDDSFVGSGGPCLFPDGFLRRRG